MVVVTLGPVVVVTSLVVDVPPGDVVVLVVDDDAHAMGPSCRQRLSVWRVHFRRLPPAATQASIAALHCEAATWEETDWPQILALYTLLATIDSSPIVRLNRAIALRYVDGAEAALYEVDGLAETLNRYHLFHATRASLLRELGRVAEADRAEVEGIGLTKNPAERALMADRLAGSR